MYHTHFTQETQRERGLRVTEETASGCIVEGKVFNHQEYKRESLFFSLVAKTPVVIHISASLRDP